MKKHHYGLVILMSILVAFVFVSGCSQATETTGNTESSGNESQNQGSTEVKQISIGGAGTAGTFYVMASGFADLINQELGINSIAEVTAGSVENNKLLGMEKIEMAVSQLDVAQSALAGTDDFDEPVDITAIAPMYPNVVQIITLKDSPINSVADLKGKKISVGSPGSGVLATNEVILETLGISMDEIDPQYLSFEETTTAFRDGSIDAAIANTAAPAPFVLDLETTHPVKLISLTDDEINTFSEEFPYYVPATISKDTYNTLDSDVSTFAVWITLIGQKALPEDAVYDVTKTIFENQEALKDVHVVAEHITLENVEKITGVPFHEGAIRYYEENGVSVPEN